MPRIKSLRAPRDKGWDALPWKAVDTSGFDMKKYFDFVLTSCEFGREKPHPAIFNEARERAMQLRRAKRAVSGAHDVDPSWCAVEPQHCIHIGNSFSTDVCAATALGWQAVYVVSEPDVVPFSSSVTGWEVNKHDSTNSYMKISSLEQLPQAFH